MKMRNIQNKRFFTTGFGGREDFFFFFFLLFQHYPLYRDSDAVCDEPDEAPGDIKSTRFRERWECLSRDATEMVRLVCNEVAFSNTEALSSYSYQHLLVAHFYSCYLSIVYEKRLIDLLN